MTSNDNSQAYYVPDGSPWPIICMVSLLLTVLGVPLMVNGMTFGSVFSIAGLLLFAYLL